MRIELEDRLLARIPGSTDDRARRAHELIVLALYRERSISGGCAAGLLDMDRMEFIRYAGRRGIPCLDMSEEELRDELAEWNRVSRG